MDQIVTTFILTIVGLMMGSFAGATIWRLRARQLVEDKGAGEAVDSTEYKKLSPLTKESVMSDRSRCLSCQHTLAWYDLLPLVSWISTKGRCRYCKTPIGWFEPVIELGTAALFALLFICWPMPLDAPLAVVHFALWLFAAVLLVILFVYDTKWFLLPNRIVFPLIAVAVAIAIVALAQRSDLLEALISLGIAMFILSGLYLILWFVSKGAWIGFGDVKLGLALALLLGSWQLAFLALLFANLIGSLIVLPGLLSGKMTRASRVPFGPLLIAGALIAMLIGQYIVEWYFLSFA